MTGTVFSDFEVDQFGVKFTGDSGNYERADCIGSMEEEMETKTITKSCRGVVVKEVTKGTGKGTLKLSLHIPWAMLTKFFDMNREGLITGVKAYGRNSTHKEFSAVMHVTDEDGAEKLKAYPKCVVKSGKATKIENGAEEVAETELEIGVTADEYGEGVYEALVSELEDETVIDTWMTAFTPALVRAV